MTRTREDGKEEVFSACIKHDDTRYLGGNKSSSVVATKLQGRPRTGINYDKANEFCANRGDWITMIDYLEYCAIQALCYIEYANFDNQAALNTNLTSDGFKQGGLGAGVTNLAWDRWTAFNGNNPIVQTYWTAEHNIGNGSTNGDHYELGNYNTDGSNLNTYPAVYRGILNFFGDIWTFIRDVVIVNRNANYNSVYLLKKGVNHADQSLTGVRYSNWNGKRTNIAKYYGKYVRIIQVINYAKYFRINFIRNGKAYYADSRDKTLFYSIHRLNHFPINFKITKYDWRIYTKNRKENIKPQI